MSRLLLLMKPLGALSACTRLVPVITLAEKDKYSFPPLFANFFPCNIPRAMSAFHLSNLFDVKGKRALITGGASGVGENMATALVHNGAHVYIASRKESQLKPVAERLTREGPGTCEYIIANISTKAGCDALAAEVAKRTDSIQILVNNSGVSWGAPLNEVPEKEGWDRVISTNVKSIFYLTVGLIPLLEKGTSNVNPSRVINISSMGSLDPRAEGSGVSAVGHGLWSYYASKAAVNQLTQTLSTTLAPKKITCNAILPGVFASKMTAWSLREHGDDFVKGQPMGRIGSPEDIGGLVLFLCSRASAHVTGALIPIDGGSLASARL